MRSEPFWLTSEDVEITNYEAVAISGENYFVRDEGLLESAVAKPQQYWNYGEDDVVILAVKLLLGIAQNHPFEQGNKRAAYATAVMFLDLNGFELAVPNSEDFGKIVEGVILGTIAEEAFTELVRACVRELPDDEAADVANSSG